jgi:hypothetical protein
LTEAARNRRTRLGCFGAIAATWWLLVAAGVYIRLMSGGALSGLVFSATVGVALLLVAYWASRPLITYHVSRNRLVKETKFGPWASRTEFTDSTLQISHRVQRNLEDLFVLEVHQHGAWTRLTSGRNQSGEVLALGRYLARQTGWRLDAPPEAGDAG